MRRRVGKGRVSQDLSPQTRSTARAPCPRVRPVFTLSPDTWARRHARAFVTSALWAGAFAHPTNDRIRAKPAPSNRINLKIFPCASIALAGQSQGDPKDEPGRENSPASRPITRL